MSDKQDSSKDNQISRRGFLKIAGAGTFFLGLGAFGISNIPNNIREASAQGANATNATNATGASAAPPSNNLAIRPFRVNVPEAELTELRRRYWTTEYDWRKVEAKLNALPQFMTEIDGLDIQPLKAINYN
jgi:hypothetical protein